MTLDPIPWATLYWASEWIVRVAALALVPRRRSAESARAWLLLILFLPWPGAIAYLLIGRAYLPRRRLALETQMRATIARVAPPMPAGVARAWSRGAGDDAPALVLAQRLSEFQPSSGNAFELLPDYLPALQRLAQDIDAATRVVHLLYYIFAADAAGRVIAEALVRAARRGVAVRVLMDAIGSRDGLRRLGPDLRAAGVEVVPVMPLRLWGHNAMRLDLRNHRKIAVIDGAVAYFGSQNVVAPDANRGLTNEELAVRATGPIVRHLDALLLADRFLETRTLPPEADLATPWTDTGAPGVPGALAQVLPSGPGYAEGTAEAVMIALMYGASTRVVLTAPYVVPNSAFLAAMCTAARRGVEVRLIVDKASNKPIVQLAQASYYDEMLAAGVTILQHRGSFLHAKHMSVDDDTVLIGSSNLDIRSFALNAEVSVLIRDAAVARQLREVQARDTLDAEPVTADARAAVSPMRRALENLARLTDAVL
ncbi:MAG: phospholipase D-like domain-containing protein [Casimicrobiaceae bacterium]